MLSPLLFSPSGWTISTWHSVTKHIYTGGLCAWAGEEHSHLFTSSCITSGILSLFKLMTFHKVITSTKKLVTSRLFERGLFNHHCYYHSSCPSGVPLTIRLLPPKANTKKKKIKKEKYFAFRCSLFRLIYRCFCVQRDKETLQKNA